MFWLIRSWATLSVIVPGVEGVGGAGGVAQIGGGGAPAVPAEERRTKISSSSSTWGGTSPSASQPVRYSLRWLL